MESTETKVKGGILMLIKKECVAMLLAGGQGSRLFALTEKTAKPAVEFGGKYRIIDLTLSNCVNSGIDTVGVLTQYQPLVLNEYIGNGQPWDLDRQSGGVMVLPPYQAKNSADWYRGTANAIYQNLTFINRYDPDYVVILSGDHIYKMDYSKMLEFHKQSQADCTIAVIEVPISEASRFGIMSADENMRITKFEEKPKNPTSNMASMGIYIFSKKILEKYLIQDEKDPNSSNDFGKNIIPAMLSDGCSLYAYRFSDYWKDVGTLTSLWEANMDLLGKSPVFNIFDRAWRIYSRSHALIPQYIGNNATVENSIITEGCEIHGTVINSVLSSGVYVAPGATVRDSIVMSGTRVMDGAVIDYSIIDSDTVIGMGAMIGEKYSEDAKLTLIGGELDISANTVVEPGEIVSPSSVSSNGKEGK